MNELWTSVLDNLGFVAVCLGVFIGLFAVAKLYERLVVGVKRDISPARRISYISMFSALAAALMFFEIPLFFAPSFYQLDFSEIPIMICTFYLGPVAGVTAELLKIIIKLFLKGTSTAFVGDFANFVVGCAFVLPASMVYHAKRTKKGALIGFAVGTAVMTIFGSAFNAIYLLPKFSELYQIPIDGLIAMGTAINPSITSIWSLVLFAVIPFNLLKGILVSILTFLLYKRVESIFFKRRSDGHRDSASVNRNLSS